jgi:hypothetical protein
MTKLIHNFKGLKGKSIYIHAGEMINNVKGKGIPIDPQKKEGELVIVTKIMIEKPWGKNMTISSKLSDLGVTDFINCDIKQCIVPNEDKVSWRIYVPKSAMWFAFKLKLNGTKGSRSDGDPNATVTVGDEGNGSKNE